MKRIVTFTLALAAVVSAMAQATPGQPAPAAPQSPNQMQPKPTAPGQQQPPVPGISQPNTRPQLPLTSNVPHNASFTNQLSGAMATLGEVEGSLLNLQANVERLLPVLATLTAGTTPAAANPNPAAPARPSPPVPTLPPTGNPNQRTPAQGQAQGTPAVPAQGMVGSVGTNFFSMNQETLQLLRLLQIRLQQTLPVLQALNNTASTGAAVAPGMQQGFNNRFVPVTNNVAPNQRMLMPTGR